MLFVDKLIVMNLIRRLNQISTIVVLQTRSIQIKFVWIIFDIWTRPYIIFGEVQEEGIN